MNLGPPERVAERLLAEFGVTTPEEIDVEVIACRCRALVVYASLTGCDGRIVGGPERAVITVNKDAPRGRRRFTVAHEIAHWIYDKGKVEGSCTEDKISLAWGKGGREQRANKFAAALLLPRSMLAELASDSMLDLRVVRRVAERFDVSLTAAAIRLVNLSSRPSMVICMSSRGREWFFRSSLVPEAIWPVRTIQSRSCLRSLAGHAGAHAGGLVSADVWVDRDDGSKYELHEDTVMITDSLSLTIVSWPDEEQITDLLDEEE